MWAARARSPARPPAHARTRRDSPAGNGRGAVSDDPRGAQTAGVYYPHPRDPDAVIDLVGLRDKAGARVRTLSGGLQRRLDLAWRLSATRSSCSWTSDDRIRPERAPGGVDIVRTLTGEGRTVLLTTHYMDEAQVLADRVAVSQEVSSSATGHPIRSGDVTRVPARIRSCSRAGDVPPTRTRRRRSHSQPVDGRRIVEIDTDSPTPLLHRLTSWLSRTKSSWRASKSPAEPGGRVPDAYRRGQHVKSLRIVASELKYQQLAYCATRWAPSSPSSCGEFLVIFASLYSGAATRGSSSTSTSSRGS